MLQAFINPSGPTREPQEVSYQSSFRFSFLINIAPDHPPRLCSGLRFTVSLTPMRFKRDIGRLLL